MQSLLAVVYSFSTWGKPRANVIVGQWYIVFDSLPLPGATFGLQFGHRTLNIASRHLDIAQCTPWERLEM